MQEELFSLQKDLLSELKEASFEEVCEKLQSPLSQLFALWIDSAISAKSISQKCSFLDFAFDLIDQAYKIALSGTIKKLQIDASTLLEVILSDFMSSYRDKLLNINGEQGNKLAQCNFTIEIAERFKKFTFMLQDIDKFIIDVNAFCLQCFTELEPDGAINLDCLDRAKQLIESNTSRSPAIGASLTIKFYEKIISNLIYAKQYPDALAFAKEAQTKGIWKVTQLMSDIYAAYILQLTEKLKLRPINTQELLKAINIIEEVKTQKLYTVNTNQLFKAACVPYAKFLFDIKKYEEGVIYLKDALKLQAAGTADEYFSSVKSYIFYILSKAKSKDVQIWQENDETFANMQELNKGLAALIKVNQNSVSIGGFQIGGNKDLCDQFRSLQYQIQFLCKVSNNNNRFLAENEKAELVDEPSSLNEVTADNVYEL